MLSSDKTDDTLKLKKKNKSEEKHLRNWYDSFAEKNVVRDETNLNESSEYRVHVARNSIKSSSNLTFLAQYGWKM